MVTLAAWRATRACSVSVRGGRDRVGMTKVILGYDSMQGYTRYRKITYTKGKTDYTWQLMMTMCSLSLLPFDTLIHPMFTPTVVFTSII